ncbi:MAG: hypothetical protein JXR37_09245 [Kiritimatiellae bacterium]|nr:hypothetical protein [Kiritimatiellia bacterium]
MTQHIRRNADRYAIAAAIALIAGLLALYHVSSPVPARAAGVEFVSNLESRVTVLEAWHVANTNGTGIINGGNATLATGTVAVADINGGAIDGTVIGANAAADATFGQATAATGTLTTATVASRFVLVGPDASTQLALEIGACTNEAVTFATEFADTPKVWATYSEDAGADTIAEAVSITATGFTMQCADAKTVNWLAIGAK